MNALELKILNLSEAIKQGHRVSVGTIGLSDTSNQQKVQHELSFALNIEEPTPEYRILYSIALGFSIAVRGCPGYNTSSSMMQALENRIAERKAKWVTEWLPLPSLELLKKNVYFNKFQ